MTLSTSVGHASKSWNLVAAVALVAAACSSNNGGGPSSGGGTKATGGNAAGGAGTTGAAGGATAGAGGAASGGVTGKGGAAGNSSAGGAGGGAAGGSGGAAGATAKGGAGGQGGGAGGAGGGSTAAPPTLSVAGGTLKIEFCAPNVVRVAFAKSDSFFSRASLTTAAKQCDTTTWQSTTGDGQVTYTTSALSVRVESTGRMTFLDLAGKTILAERPNGGRTLTAATVQGESTFNVRQEWEPSTDESLYGLGQHQQ